MAIKLDESAFINAALEMKKLKVQNDTLEKNLTELFRKVKEALQTPAGEKLHITGEDVLLEPIRNMGIVIEHMSKTLDTIIGNGDSGKGFYYDKIFQEYSELNEMFKGGNTI